jgi:hypothetical protein
MAGRYETCQGLEDLQNIISFVCFFSRRRCSVMGFIWTPSRLDVLGLLKLTALCGEVRVMRSIEAYMVCTLSC